MSSLKSVSNHHSIPLLHRIINYRWWILCQYRDEALLNWALLMVDELNYLIDSVPIMESKFKYLKCIYNCRVEDLNWQEFSWNWHHIIVFIYWNERGKQRNNCGTGFVTDTDSTEDGMANWTEHQMRTTNGLSSAKASSFLIISNYLHNAIIPGYHEHRMSKRTFILMLMLLGWLRLVWWSKWGRISDKQKKAEEKDWVEWKEGK